jgi:site-specific DNA recombinase
MKKAVGYVRVSADSHSDTAAALSAQRRQIARFAATRGYRLVELVEAATSGVALEGPSPLNGQASSLLRLMERAKARDFDALIVAAEDRLSDDPVTVSVLARHFVRHGVEVLAAAGRPEREPSAMRIATVPVAEEAQLRLERFSAGKARKKALGRHVHGRAPYGYRSVHGVLQPIEALVPMVRRIFEEAAAGRTPGSIARALNSEGIAPPQGGRAWTEQSLRVILGNIAYTGERYGVKGAHAALVSRKVWNAAQAALKARRRR